MVMEKRQDIQLEELANGVRLVYERLPYVRTAAIGIWVESGTRHEPEELCGISHFIEHMVFKGTPRRSAREIAEQMDGIGGQMNAFTASECTCFYARALDTHIQLAADVLCDMFFHANFAQEDIRLERNVIFEEIGMYQDSPEDLVVDRLNEAVYRGSALGRPILGSRKALRGLNTRILREYRERYYTSEAIVIALAGSFPDTVIDFIKEEFSHMPRAPKPFAAPAAYQPTVTLRRKEIEQNHLCIAFPTPGVTSPDRYAIQLMSTIFGGGMSSRLFQSVREQAGLCYSIATFVNACQDQGLYCIQTALGKETEDAAVSLILDEIQRMREVQVEEEELNRVREQYKANLMMGMENTGARMNNLAQNVIRFHKPITADAIIQEVDRVTPDKIQREAQRIFQDGKRSFSAVGNLRSAAWYQRRFSL